jgi:multidrug efflux pump subunit AcrA (membrane-fusion protein)
MKTKQIIILGLIILVSAGSYFFWKQSNHKNTNKDSVITNNNAEETNYKNISSITFGQWKPSENRTILGTVESPSDIQIVAENSGTIEKILVNTGQSVIRGELLATYKTSNDLSQIQYTNALNSLQTTKISGESSVQNAEINLKNAQNEYDQSVRTADQSIDQAFITLSANRESAETTVKTVRDYVDRAFGVSNRYQSQRDTDFEAVGRNNSILRQQTRTVVNDLVIDYNQYDTKNWLDDYDYYRLPDQEKAIYRAKEVSKFLDQTKTAMNNMVQLIRSSNTSSSFTSTERDTLQTEAENLLSSVNTAIITLDTQIESTRTTSTGQDSSLSAAQNRIAAARTQLKLAEANAGSQIISAESQLRLAQKSRQDLEIRAPFTGTITEKLINNFDRVNSGEALFSLVSDGSLPEIVANVTPEEWNLLSNKTEPLAIKLNGGDTIFVEDITMNGKLSAASQKFSIKLLPSAEDIANKKIFIGSFAEIQLPLSNEENNLVPISAVSFEPSGTEVLVLTEQSEKKFKTERSQVKTGKIIGNAIEIIEGLTSDEKIVEFRHQVKSGEEVSINNKK